MNSSIVTLLVLAAVIGVIIRPGIALVVIGVAVVIFGLIPFLGGFAIDNSPIIGAAVGWLGFPTIVSGIVLIALGQAVTAVQNIRDTVCGTDAKRGGEVFVTKDRDRGRVDPY